MNCNKSIRTLCTLLLAASTISTAFAQHKKTLFIIVDGIPTDMIHKAHTPNIDRIIDRGVLLESYVGGIRGGYSETPTISANGYATYITGTWGHKHNVLGNEIKAPNYHYPTLFRLFKDDNSNGKIAIYSTWLDNRTKLIGEGLEETQKLKFDYHYDGLELDTISYPHDLYRNYIKRIDTDVALQAAKGIYRDAPDLSWVYLEYTDDMGHIYGEGPEFYNSIAFEDGLIGLIYDSVLQREKEFGEDWLVIVTTDHGRTPLTAQHHGGQSDRERNTWVVLNKKDINQYATNHRVAAVDILPTIFDFMDIQIPVDKRNELDGVSLLSPIDAYHLSARLIGNQLLLEWDCFNEDSEADVLVTFSNNFKYGGTDTYLKVAHVSLRDRSALVNIDKPDDTSIIKIILNTPTNTLNYWIRK